ncbi:cytochrome bc complex cytochrome b subunit [Candidatus Aminicenantes bacterium AC-335-A11]|jgi:cytochrome b6|nr:cytochrome bc complex cytochrome b subunit [SCandidatus Aminicenantes bacterium Aminicenantia_JdfR_composite]MCP2618679.1 cytochrome bc complex cytochrome b subunit [Candidatus Aminicenantes bacterium AC-335-A11]
MKTFWEKIWLYFDYRFKISDLAQLTKKKKVPEHKYSFWYYFGGICLFLFIIQVITGILLLLYYTPSADSAFESIQYIMSQVKFGWLIRSVHSWSANLLIGAIFIHMFSTFFLRAYRPPRELTWVTGFFLLLIFLAFGFTGYLLPWNKLAFFATRVGTDIVGIVPIIGEKLKTFLLGGKVISNATLPRFFWIHVAVLPFITVLILGVHLLLVQTLGMSTPIGLSDREVKEIPFFPNFVLKDFLAWILILGLIGILCVFFPWEIGEKADPFASAPPGIKPEWYFTFMFTTLKIIPSKILFIEGEKLALFGFFIGGLFWLLIPFLDKKAQKEEKSKLFFIIGLLILIYIIVMTLVTYFFPKL